MRYSPSTRMHSSRGVIDDFAAARPLRRRWRRRDAAPPADGSRVGSAARRPQSARAAACSGSQSPGSCRAARSKPCPPRESDTAPRSRGTARRPARRARAAARRAGSPDSPARQRDRATRGGRRIARLPVHRIGVEHAAHQSRDANRLARLRDHAADAFAEAHLGARAVLRVTARRDRDEHALFFGGHENHRCLKPKLSSRPARIESTSSSRQSARWMRPARSCMRLHREDRIAVACDRGRCPASGEPPVSSATGFDRPHLVDVGGAQLEDALQAAIRRDRLDPQRHAIEERPSVSERT